LGLENEKISSQMDYLQFYELESYLFRTVRKRFETQKYLSAFDFFCIIIWKANRAKSKIATKILSSHTPVDGTFENRVHSLTRTLCAVPTSKDKMRYLIEEWGFRLPTASAILTVLYPEEFTVYDKRVCDQLQRLTGESGHSKIGGLSDFELVWEGYQRFKVAVEEAAPKEFSLRDKDRYFWGKSFCEQLIEDIRRGFS
jgi:hypothetical protein